jgi:hypothetical protein
VSNPLTRTTFQKVRPGDMGHFWAEWIFEWFEHSGLQIEVPRTYPIKLTSQMFHAPL